MSIQPVTWDETVQDWADDETPDNPWVRRPDGFQPTRERPIPGMQCRGTTKNGPNTGQRCGRHAIYGGTVCIVHGGKAPQVMKKAAAIVQMARMALTDNAMIAVDVIEDLMRNATSEPVRLKAATEVLDRVGVRGGTEVDVSISANQDPAETLRERLKTLQSRTTGAIEAEPGSLQDTSDVSPSASDGVTVQSTVNFDTEEQT